MFKAHTNSEITGQVCKPDPDDEDLQAVLQDGEGGGVPALVLRDDISDPNAEFPREIYSVDRKSAENREVVEFELAAAFDLAGIRVPKRQCTRALFPAIGTFIQ